MIVAAHMTFQNSIWESLGVNAKKWNSWVFMRSPFLLFRQLSILIHKGLIQSITHQQWMRVFFLPHICLHFVYLHCGLFVCFFNAWQSLWCEMLSQCFYLNFPDARRYRSFLCNLLAITISYLRLCVIILFFFIRLFDIVLIVF